MLGGWYVWVGWCGGWVVCLGSVLGVLLDLIYELSKGDLFEIGCEEFGELSHCSMWLGKLEPIARGSIT